MFSLNKKVRNVQAAAGLLPTALSVAFMAKQSVIFLLLCVLSLFVVVGAVPLFRKRESLFMFILVAIAGLPVNIGLAYWLVFESFINSGFLLGDILWMAFLCCVLFSVEEIAFGVITRLIWKKQYRLKV